MLQLGRPFSLKMLLIDAINLAFIYEFRIKLCTCLFLKYIFFPVLFSSHHYPLGGPYPIRVPLSSWPILQPTPMFRHRLNLQAGAVSVGCRFGVVLHSRVYDVIIVIGPIFRARFPFCSDGFLDSVCRLRERSHISKTRVRPKLRIYFIASEKILGAESNSGPHGQNFMKQALYHLSQPVLAIFLLYQNIFIYY